MAKGKILVVDDEKVIREGFTKLLSNEGYEVVTAKDESECLEVFKEGAFNLVMMDIKLPGADGVKLLNKLKGMDPDIEGMIITGYASLESAIEALKSGVSEYITKPFDRDEDVVRVVNRLVEKQKLAVENKRLQEEETHRQRDELKRRVFELEVLYDVSNSIVFNIDYKELLKDIMNSLGKVIDYDLAASFLIIPNGGEFTLRPNRAITKGFMKQVIDNIIESITSLTDHPIGKDISIDVEEIPPPRKDEKPLEKANSLFDIPLIVKDRAIGMLNVSSSKKNAFDLGAIRFLYTISNQIAGGIEKLRSAIAAAAAAEAVKKRSEELEKAYSELRDTQVQLVQSEKLSALGELSAGIAHELNQPLNNIKIIGQSMLRDIQKDRYKKEDVEPDLKGIVNQVNKMAEIIDHMRVFSRRTVGMTKEEVDVGILVEGAFKFTGQQLKDRNIEVKRELSPDLPKPIGDPIRLEQAILDLITNARNAVESSGKEDKRIEIKTYKMDKQQSPIDKPSVVVEVKDNGLGVPEDLREKIFEPFFTTSKPGEGTGLGLSVAQRIIEEHKGKIELESKVGEGAIFRVILPIG